MSWDPGPRPAWVQHAIDGEGGPVYSAAMRPLVVDELLAEAELRAGSSDFGGDDFFEPLEVFVRSVEEEADLHVVGRWRVREVVLRALENRLRIAAYISTDEQVSREPIIAPIIVTGSPRAGTSVMHELLALLPDTRAPMAWEYWWPAPPPAADDDSDPRIALADRDVRLSAALAPAFDGMHLQGARVPREDPSAMVISFRSDVLAAHYPTPSYRDWLASCDMRPAYDSHRLVLQILQRRRPRSTWVLKAPSHLGNLRLLLQTYPDARIVICHRDPLAMISSVTSLIATLRWGHADNVDKLAVARECIDQFGTNLDSVMRLRQDGELTDGCVFDVRFDRFVVDQSAVVHEVARHFGLEADDRLAQRIVTHLGSKPPSPGGSHVHSLDDLGLDIAELHRRFEPYMSYFGVADEMQGR